MKKKPEKAEQIDDGLISKSDWKKFTIAQIRQKYGVSTKAIMLYANKHKLVIKITHSGGKTTKQTKGKKTQES